MGLHTRVMGPRSKHDRTLPYTYYARVPAVEGRDEYFLYYFGDTICTLIDYLDQNGIAPGDVEIFGVYRQSDIAIDTTRCTSAQGGWLHRPDICRALELHFAETRDARYKGHIERGTCAFDDREREGAGPI